MAQNNKNAKPIMANLLQKFFREKEVAWIEHMSYTNEGKYCVIEVVKDSGESHMTLRITEQEYLELMLESTKTKILTANGKKELGIEDEAPKPAPPPDKPAPTIKEPPKDVTEFKPPTKPLDGERQRMTKPGEQELYDQFEAAWAALFPGRKRLTGEEKEARDKAQAIAKSYILSGDRTTVKKWVEYLKTQVPK